MEGERATFSEQDWYLGRRFHLSAVRRGSYVEGEEFDFEHGVNWAFVRTDQHSQEEWEDCYSTTPWSQRTAVHNVRGPNFLHHSAIDGVLEFRRDLRELPHDVATTNVLEDLEKVFHEALDQPKPLWSHYVEQRTVNGAVVETKHWMPVDVRHDADRLNIEHVVTVAMAMIVQTARLPLIDRRIDFVDAKNMVHSLTSTQAIEALWPVLAWIQDMWTVFQKRKGDVRLCLTNRQIRDLPKLVWPAVPDGPTEDAKLTKLGVSVAGEEGPMEILATLPDPYNGEILEVEVPYPNTGYFVIAEASQADAVIVPDMPLTRAFPITETEQVVLLGVFSSTTAETQYRLLVRRAASPEGQ